MTRKSDSPQLHVDLQGVKAILGGRHVLGIKADQVLRPQLAQNVGEGAIQLGAELGVNTRPPVPAASVVSAFSPPMLRPALLVIGITTIGYMTASARCAASSAS